MIKIAALSLVLLSAAVDAAAEVVTGSTIEECVLLEQDSARLACFDAYAKTVTQQDPEQTAAPVEATPVEATPVETPAESKSVRAEPLEVPPSTQEPPPWARDVVPEQAEKPEAKTLTARVESFVRLKRSDKVRITLDNGQVWQETDVGNFRGSVRPGAEVTIAERRFGGFKMSVPGRSAVIFVRRLK